MTCNIEDFVEKKIDGGKNNVVFYKVAFGFMKSKKTWELEKRYSDFDTLDKILKEMYPNLPSLPGKTLFKLSDRKMIEDRMKVLNQYMKVSVACGLTPGLGCYQQARSAHVASFQALH